MNAREQSKEKAAAIVAEVRRLWPANLHAQLAYCALCIASSAAPRQNASTPSATVPWEYVHAVRTIEKDIKG